MGGTVGETIRRQNGEVIKMARKTGAYNWMFFTKEFGEGQFDKAIDNHIKIFLEMKKDFESGEPYDFPMSPVYGWCNETLPIDYGLVVIDFKTKKIHSMQGYDNPGYHYVSMLSRNVIQDKEVDDNFDYLISKNLLYIVKDDKLFDIEEKLGKNFNLEKLRKKLSSKLSILGLGKDDFFNTYFITKKLVDEFELYRYEETPEDVISFLENLINDGFNLTIDEIKGWKKRIEDFDCDYFLDEKEDNNTDEKIEERKNLLINKVDFIINFNDKKKLKI